MHPTRKLVTGRISVALEHVLNEPPLAIGEIATREIVGLHRAAGLVAHGHQAGAAGIENLQRFLPVVDHHRQDQPPHSLGVASFNPLSDALGIGRGAHGIQ